MTECPSCHTVPPTPHSDYCQIVDHASQLTHAELYPNHTQQILTAREPWLGHRDACSLQWSDECDCDNGPEYLAEQRPEDDPPDPVICDGRNCGGAPHG